MSNALESVQTIGVVAVLGAGLYLAWRYILAPLEAAGLAGPGAGPVEVPNPIAPVYNFFDQLGGDKGTYCATLGHNIFAGMTCPTPEEWDPTKNVYVPPTPMKYMCPSLGIELYDMSLCPPMPEPSEDHGYIPNMTDKCTSPFGKVVTVPLGMNCNEAIEDMCHRFGPGHGWC